MRLNGWQHKNDSSVHSRSTKKKNGWTCNVVLTLRKGFNLLLFCSKQRLIHGHSYANAFIPQKELHLSQDIKKYCETHTEKHVTTTHTKRHSLWGFWPLSISWIHVPLRRKQQESALVSLKANTTSKTQVLDTEQWTDGDLNISENEAYTPGRREGSSGENMWKTFGLRAEGYTVQYELMKNTSERQKTRRRAVNSTNYISKQTL